MRKLFAFVVVLLLSLSAFPQTTRHFTFHYAFSVRNLQPGQKLEVWFPQAHSDQFQDVKIISVTGDLPLKTTRDSKYGNTIYYAVAPTPRKTNTPSTCNTTSSAMSASASHATVHSPNSLRPRRKKRTPISRPTS